MKTALCFCIHDDVIYLTETLAILRADGEAANVSFTCVVSELRGVALAAHVFISRLPWHGTVGDWQTAASTAEALGATVHLGDWPTEREQRQAACDHLRAAGYTHALIPDGDEIIEPALLRTLLTLAEHDLADRVYVHWDTYWKTPEYVIRPRERFTPCYLIDLRVAVPTGGRNFEGGRPLLLGPEYGIVHHLSWVGPEVRIRRKLETWGHAREVIDGWYDRVWRIWDDDRTLRNLHPTHPEAYGFAERIHVPEILAPALAHYRELSLGELGERVAISEQANCNSERVALTPPTLWPPIRVVIPVHGGRDDLAACLAGLEPLCAEGLLRGVVVVDNASPEGTLSFSGSLTPFPSLASERGESETPILVSVPGQNKTTPDLRPTAPDSPLSLAREGKGVSDRLTLIQNPTNTGFAHACNQGADAAHADEHLLFLNSDAILTRAGLIRMVESLQRSGAIGAVGPWTNRAGHGQQIEPTYTDVGTLDLFADDWAARDADDSDRNMLVGFCLLVRCSVWEEVKENGVGFDTRFGLGTWEDNDLCYRIRRAGYRLVLSERAFVHHGGSKTLQRVFSGTSEFTTGDVSALLTRNRALFLAKWREDLETGFASTLSGLTGERIVFDPARHPDIRRRQVRERARRADISLIMIVRDEERVLSDCLRSAMPFFRETIVVDTGSTDRTREIAVEAGAKVFDFPWTNSFSDARNESLRHATGKWIFWLDADDTLPWASGEAILDAALTARPEVCGFVVPVQFVEPLPGEDGTVPPSAAGTRVDHVKLFRNLPGLTFEGRIHEQILPSLRAASPVGAIARIDAVVMHTGYDTSVAGQAKKRDRDATLLALDLAERPGHPFVLFNLGMTDHYAGLHETAVDWLQQSIAAASPSGESHIRKAYALMAVSLRELGRQDEALQAITTGLAAVGDDPELHFHAGYLLTQMTRYAEARAHYERVAGADASGYFSSFDVGILGYKTFHNLGQVCHLMGDYTDARTWWLRSIEAAPQFLPSAFDLFHAAVESGDRTTAQAMLDAVETQQGRSANWAAMAARLAGAATPIADKGIGPPVGDAAEIGFLRATVGGDAHATGPRLELARRLLQAGNEAEAQEHLVWLAEQGVAEASFFLGVCAIRRDDLPSALAHMERALALNPNHTPTQAQVDNLRRALESPGTD